jgi:hypothetical protein
LFVSLCDSDSWSAVIAEPNSSKDKGEASEKLWRKFITDTARLVNIYQDFAHDFIKIVSLDENGVWATDMSELVKPTPFEHSVKRLMSAFTEKAYQKSFDDAFGALDYDITDNLFEAKRILKIRYHDARKNYDDGPSPSRIQRCAAEKYLDQAKKYLSMWEQMTADGAMEKAIKAQVSINPDAIVEQFIELAEINDGCLSVNMVEEYIRATQAYRAALKLKDFLAKVKLLTKALVSTFDDLEKLQK